MQLVQASFEIEVTADDAAQFAQLSGDWNPLHTDPQYAARTSYGRPILHGAFSAGLVSRMAGMYLPGTDCLLHNMRLRFVSPIIPPARLVVAGRQTHADGDFGRVEVEISDAVSGTRYVEAVYEHGHHTLTRQNAPALPIANGDAGGAVTLVTGANGELGSAVLRRLADRGQGLSRHAGDDVIVISDFSRIADKIGSRDIIDIVHCGWPHPDNAPLLELENLGSAIDHHIAAPLRDVVCLAQLLRERGTKDAMLVLVGSAAAESGRHAFRSPLYSVAKSTIPVMCRILALELATTGQRCAAVVYDVIDGGMNAAMSPATRIANADRTPNGVLPSPDDAAAQIVWLLQNRSAMISGATVSLTGGALP